MKNTVNVLRSLKIISVTAALLPFTFSLQATEFFEPAMVAIPAGSFYMGSDKGATDERPVRKVEVSAFQIGKYEVTFAEFQKFAEATDFQMEDRCYQYVLGGPNRLKFGSWDNNIYIQGDYYPVVCVTIDAANDYAAWLSGQTGKPYRLPTEAEWEYAARAGTQTRFHFGSEKDAAKACEYGNVSDWYAADKSADLFEGANVVEIEKCSDNEAITSMVGLYKPNPFGVHDMLGNVNEYVQDCYQSSYEGAPNDGSAVLVDDCKEIVVRGSSWHWFPYASSQRYALPIDDTIGALEGFRLVLDTDGKSVAASKGTQSFIEALQVAQQTALARHQTTPQYPNPPEGLKLLTRQSNQIKLRWQENLETWVSGYKVYRQDPLNNKIEAVSPVLTNTQFVDEKPLAHNARYYVVALNGVTESQPSTSVDSNFETVHTLPALIQGEAYTNAEEPDVHLSGLEPEGDKVILSLDNRYAEYSVKSQSAQTFKLEARVFHSGGEQNLKVWVGDRLIASQKIEGERGWKSLKDIEITLPKGKSLLRVRGENDLFAINWLNFVGGIDN